MEAKIEQIISVQDQAYYQSLIQDEQNYQLKEKEMRKAFLSFPVSLTTDIFNRTRAARSNAKSISESFILTPKKENRELTTIRGSMEKMESYEQMRLTLKIPEYKTTPPPMNAREFLAYFVYN